MAERVALRAIFLLNSSSVIYGQANYSSSGRNEIVLTPKTLSTALRNFHTHQAEITLAVDSRKTIINNFDDKTLESTGQNIRSQLSLHPAEFTAYRIGLDTAVNFTVREIKAMLAFAENVSGVLKITFDEPTKPIVFNVSEAGMYEANYILATDASESMSTIGSSTGSEASSSLARGRQSEPQTSSNSFTRGRPGDPHPTHSDLKASQTNEVHEVSVRGRHENEASSSNQSARARNEQSAHTSSNVHSSTSIHHSNEDHKQSSSVLHHRERSNHQSTSLLPERESSIRNSNGKRDSSSSSIAGVRGRPVRRVFSSTEDDDLNGEAKRLCTSDVRENNNNDGKGLMSDKDSRNIALNNEEIDDVGNINDMDDLGNAFDINCDHRNGSNSMLGVNNVTNSKQNDDLDETFTDLNQIERSKHRNDVNQTSSNNCRTKSHGVTSNGARKSSYDINMSDEEGNFGQDGRGIESFSEAVAREFQPLDSGASESYGFENPAVEPVDGTLLNVCTPLNPDKMKIVFRHCLDDRGEGGESQMETGGGRVLVYGSDEDEEMC
ncbi:hypothetical protein WDU94_003560 [Cyamophila willieti]